MKVLQSVSLYAAKLLQSLLLIELVVCNESLEP